VTRICLAVLLALSTVAVTAAPKLTNVWKSPEVARLSFAGKKVAALVLTSSMSLQMSGEEALARELTARGVGGVATYRIAPGEVLKNVETAKAWFEKTKVEGVVALRPVRREKTREASAVVWTSGYYPSFWGYYGYGWNNVYVPISTRDVTTITVETLVYDVTRDQLVWAATSDTRDPETLQDFIKDLVNAAVKEMRKMKLVG
jgi:hypothetical protein